MSKSSVYTLLGILVVLLLAIGIWSTNKPAQAPVVVTSISPSPTTVVVAKSSPSPVAVASPSFEPEKFTQKKSAHFVSSEPANNALVTAAPTHVKINFNFDLATNSTIAVTNDGVSVVSGPVTFGADKLSMSIPVKATQTGNYTVTYNACWPDKSCHDGSFGFSVQLK